MRAHSPQLVGARGCGAGVPTAAGDRRFRDTPYRCGMHATHTWGGRRLPAPPSTRPRAEEQEAQRTSQRRGELWLCRSHAKANFYSELACMQARDYGQLSVGVNMAVAQSERAQRACGRGARVENEPGLSVGSKFRFRAVADMTARGGQNGLSPGADPAASRRAVIRAPRGRGVIRATVCERRNGQRLRRVADHRLCPSTASLLPAACAPGARRRAWSRARAPRWARCRCP